MNFILSVDYVQVCIMANYPGGEIDGLGVFSFSAHLFSFFLIQLITHGVMGDTYTDPYYLWLFDRDRTN